MKVKSRLVKIKNWFMKNKIHVFLLLAFISCIFLASAIMISYAALDEVEVKNVYLDYVFLNKVNSVSEYESLVSHVSNDGSLSSDIFMDSFLPCPSASYKPPGSTSSLSSNRNLTKDEWDLYLIDLFNNLDNLNIAVGNINTNTSANVKINVFLTVVTPHDTMSVSSSKENTLKYFVDSQVDMFTSKNYYNLKLAGFYWNEEGVRSPSEESLMQWLTNYSTSLGYKSFWVPYIDNYNMSDPYDEGNMLYRKGKSVYGFSYEALQSGYYFRGDDATFMAFHGSKRLPFANTELNNYDMGIEVEVDGDAFGTEKLYNRYLDYLKAGVNGNWNDKVIVYYAIDLDKGATSPNSLDRELYDITYKYANKTLTLADLDITYSKGYNTNFTNVSTGKSYTTSTVYTEGGMEYANVSGHELTDESFGNTGYGTDWIAFVKGAPEDKHQITLDLGTDYSSLSYVALELENIPSAGIGLPPSIKVYTSDDGVSFNYLGDCSYLDTAHYNQGLAYLDTDPFSARYVRLVIEKGTSAFVFASEMVVGRTASINLASESGSTSVGDPAIEVAVTTDNAGALSASSSNPSVATVSIVAGKLVITPVAAGSATITVTEGSYGISKEYNVTVLGPYLTGIEVKTNPDKMSYFRGTSSLDLTGGVLKATLSDGSIFDVSMLDILVSVSGFDNSSLGTNTITLTYEGKTTTLGIIIIAPVVTKIEVKTNPTKMSYIKSYESLNLAGGTILVTLSDTTTIDIPMDNASVSNSGFDNSSVGTNIVTLSYEGFTTTLNVNIIEPVITKIEVKTNPTKMDYIKGYESLDLTGGVLKATLSDTTTADILMSDALISASGFNNSSVGTSTVTLTYKGFTTTLPVNIVNPVPTKIEVKTDPTQMTYIKDSGTLDLTGGVLKVTLSDTNKTDVLMTDSSVSASGFDNTSVGLKTITLTYGGFTTTFNITVMEASITEIVVDTLPDKINYTKDYETLSLTGGKLIAKYNNGVNQTIFMDDPAVTTSGFSNSSIGVNSITINYKGVSTTFDVNIVAPYVVKIEVKTNPVKTNYVLNTDSLDVTGGVLMATLSDTTTIDVLMTDPAVTISGFNNTVLGANTITALYNSVSTTFNVNIIPPVVVSSIAVSSLPSKVDYVQGTDNLNLTGGSITVNYSDGSSKVVSMTDSSVTVTGFSNVTVGSNTLTVSYEGKSINFDVNIKAPSAYAIAVSKMPDKVSYTKDVDSLSLTGGELTVSFDNGTSNVLSLLDPGVTVTGFNNSVVGVNTLTLSYNGFTTTFDVSIVSPLAVHMTSLSVKTNPTKISYIQSTEGLDLTGGVLAASYSDGSSRDVSMLDPLVTTSGFSNSIIGSKIVTLYYDGYQTVLSVNIVPREVTVVGVSILKMPDKISYNKGDSSVSLTGGLLSVSYSDGTVSDILMTDGMVIVSGFDTSSTGSKTITISVGGKDATFIVNVSDDGSPGVIHVPDTGVNGSIVTLIIGLLIALGGIIYVAFYRRNHYSIKKSS